VSTKDARHALIEMAQVWSRLADQQEIAFPPIPASEGSQPIAQQQQQIQPKKDGTE
jgi:hypothetical protein